MSACDCEFFSFTPLDRALANLLVAAASVLTAAWLAAPLERVLLVAALVALVVVLAARTSACDERPLSRIERVATHIYVALVGAESSARCRYARYVPVRCAIESPLGRWLRAERTEHDAVYEQVRADGTRVFVLSVEELRKMEARERARVRRVARAPGASTKAAR